MKSLLILFLCSISLGVVLGYDCIYCQPEQIHIAFGETTNTIVVTWTTFDDTLDSKVEYGVGVMDQEAAGYSTLFTDGGKLKRKQYIHRVTLPNLKFNTTYAYHAGSKYGWSEEMFFHVPPAGNTGWTVRAALYGDMGNKNAQSMSYLQDEAQRGMYDVILHVGDFAYDMDTDNALVGDQFMRQIQPLAGYVPYMVCPGNHEEKYNFSNYRNRFSMPGGYESLFYSFNMGPIHFISVNTEAYYFYGNYGLKPLVNQYEWLVKDLQEASNIENRKKRPWIILYGHKPMYCSNDDREDCRLKATRTRVGIPGKLFGMEKLLYDYGVDIVVWAHEHSYERTWPLYDYKVYNGSLEQPYVNPRAPIHVITGSAGCQENRDKFVKNPAEWSAFHSNDYGYTRFKAYNGTHIHMEQVSVDLEGKVIDEFWVVKEQHVAYKYLKN